MSKKALVLLLVGALSWSLVMVKSGLAIAGGVGFWGPNGHDGIWHIALANSLAHGSLDFPTFAGQRLTNYHLGFDLLLAGVSKLTTIPTHILYFQILPPLLALAIGILTYKFVLAWRKSDDAASWALFFVFFGGSWAWAFGKGESMFWSQQAISTLINPPLALSFVVMLAGLLVLLAYEKKKKRGLLLLASLLFGILIQVKAYAGVLAIGGLIVAGTWRLIKEKKVDILEMAGFSTLISYFLLKPLGGSANELIIFKPFWFLETMMQLTDRVGWLKFGDAMINYKWGGVWIKAIPAYFIAFLIFWYGNMGSRLLGEIFIGKSLAKVKKLGVMEVFLFSVIAGGTLAPMLFLQTGTPWNTIQFFYYSLFFAGILAGISVSKIKKKYLLVLIAVVTLPTTYITLKNDYLPSRPPAKLSQAEVEALSFLAKQPEGTVLTYPFDRAKADAAIVNPPRPLYLYESTAYVAAYGNKPVFLEDEVNLDITGYDWKTRREEVLNWLTTQNHELAYNFLRENNIRYIYWVDGQRAVLGEEQLGIGKIFENGEVNVFVVK